MTLLTTADRALHVTKDELLNCGLDADSADAILGEVQNLKDVDPALRWATLTRTVLTSSVPFQAHALLFERNYRKWGIINGPPPAWIPAPEESMRSNIGRLMKAHGFSTYQELYDWSVDQRERFWEVMIETVGVKFKEPYTKMLALDRGVEEPDWLVGARMNIADSCFSAPRDSTAIIYQRDDDEALQTVTYGELEALTNRVANGLVDAGFLVGDAIGVVVPMTVEAVALYLGAIKAGMNVVSIADSFAPHEIELRLRVGNAKAVFIQDFVLRGDKKIPLYDKLADIKAPRAFVVPVSGAETGELRAGDTWWGRFMSSDEHFESVACSPDAHTNILFSSGTTAEPKAIPWSHTTPIKCAVDGYLHHDIRAGDVIAWPTSLGWMMGPWLIYAGLMNGGTIALHYGVPTSRGFCEFVRHARVNMLGVVPTLVKAWISGNVLAGVDWSAVKLFSSTGECSNHSDMLYLMSKAGYKPVVEYCGGTEIGGGYITGTVVQPAAPATFTTPSLGLKLVVLDDDERRTQQGEVYLVPPSIGLSTELLNRDHHETYFSGTPMASGEGVLRRHGDEIEVLPGGFFRAHGRTDDTMNLGGIKVSAATIERSLRQVDGIQETAVVAVTPEGGGPSRLVVFAVLEPGHKTDREKLRMDMQTVIKKQLNPLFKVSDVVLVDALPRTASNKIMRRVLRERYMKENAALEHSCSNSG